MDVEIIWLIGLGPIVVGLLVAVCVRFLLMRAAPRLGGRVAVSTTVAAGLLVVVQSVVHVLAGWSLLSMGEDWAKWSRVLYALPLVLGVVAIIVLMIPAPHGAIRGTAEVAPRTVPSFVPWWWVVALAMLVAIVVALSVAAGAASETDEQGRLLMFMIEAGTASMGTTIYGWYFSVPSLVAVAVLVLATLLAWALVPRPAWGDDVAGDRAVRRMRCANIGRMACAALLLHLAAVLNSLTATASLSGMVNTSEAGPVIVGTPFAALAPLLQWAGWAALAAGLALGILTALTAVSTSVRRRALATA